MSATVFLETPLDDEHKIECAEAKIVGDVVLATPDGDGKDRVIPVSNVTGVTGDEVEQDVEEVEFPGGRVTELITYLY
ncbi:hypothetical protein ACFQJD_10300 [Haloplanus sp. GCM10025708]|uniref:hypothetical protein n=1 Tax=Haloferacaceae TaxID=1644056 RepID=UPI0036155A55